MTGLNSKDNTATYDSTRNLKRTPGNAIERFIAHNNSSIRPKIENISGSTKSSQLYLTGLNNSENCFSPNLRNDERTPGNEIQPFIAGLNNKGKNLIYAGTAFTSTKVEWICQPTHKGMCTLHCCMN